jgi:hypothetical protein
MKKALLALLLLGLCTACGSNRRAILYAGIRPGVAGHRIVISDARARAMARNVTAQWLAGLAADAKRSSDHFPNLSEGVFRLRLEAAASQYGFKIVRLHFYKPRQLAPYVVVETEHYLRLSRAIPTIAQLLDPHAGHADQSGWTYEGFYFQGNDERGIPFVIVSDLTRGQVEGSQFARSEELYPYAHA